MVRTIVTPENTHLELDIPPEYVGKTIEITYLALDELAPKPSRTMADFWGILSDKTAAELKEEIKRGREEWDRDI
jgi:hypothetical protein